MNDTIPLFPEAAAPQIRTEGVKYTGSKLKLLPYILDLASKTGARSILDGFAGSSRVSQAFAQNGYQVHSNDFAVWSKVFSTCYLHGTPPGSVYQSLIDHLNNLTPIDGWFTEHYGGNSIPGEPQRSDGLKAPWQVHNTKKLDAIRDELDRIELDDVSKSVALTSLIIALDRVDSTLGHHASYLRQWSPRSYNNLRLEVPQIPYSENRASHVVSQKDIFNVIDTADCELAYLDPPYGSNNEKMPPSRVRYQAYYHLWTTVCLNDRPEVFGKVRRRKDSGDSVHNSSFEDFRRDTDGRFIALNAIENMLKASKARWIILSYSSGGRATASELDAVIRRHGNLKETLEIDFKRNVMASMRWTHEWLREAEKPNREFLFLIQKY